MGTTKEDIKNTLWKGADTFRDTIDAANYKDYILSILFVKYLSNSYQEMVDNLKKDYDGIRLERQLRYLPFQIQAEHTFDYLYEHRYDENLGQVINIALRGIEDDNSNQLMGVFRSIDFNSQAMLGERLHRNSILRELLEDFVDLDLRPSQIITEEGKVPADTIGDAYEYMIGQFASKAGKKAGSFFTPTSVSEIMARIVNAKPHERVYDPTCGSGSLLIRTAKKAGTDEVSIYGQEMNGSAVAMAKMNMFIHEIRDAKIAWGDTLANPLHLDGDGNLLTFDVVVANMPFSKDKWASGFNPGGESDGKKNKGKDKEFKMEPQLDKHHRFDWGAPPSSKGDWAFLLHMIHSLAPGGRVAAVAPHGVLFRGASEGLIRRKVIEENLLDAVIGLPENLFFGTSIPACILIFKKNRDNANVLFIDASGTDEKGQLRYVKGKNQNELNEKHINDIITAYQERVSKERFCYVATVKEIRQKNDYNLNIPRYVDTFEEEELIDIEAVKMNITNIKTELAEVEEEMAKYLKELGL